MEPMVFCAVLAAAAMHAGWNVLVKLGLDRFQSVSLIGLASALLCLPFVPVVATPSAGLWIWIAGSAALHTLYKLTLVQAYRSCDLGQAYPIARGTAPLIVATIGLVWLGEALAPMLLVGIAALSAGVMLMALKGGRPDLRSLGFALATAGFIAAYTLVDGLGARRAESAGSFAIYLFLTDGVLMLAIFLGLRGRAGLGSLAKHWRLGLLGGGLSLGAYWIAIWAMTQAPIAAVAALRETGVLFALVLSRLLLGERLTRVRLHAAGLIVLGAALLRLV